MFISDKREKSGARKTYSTTRVDVRPIAEQKHLACYTSAVSYNDGKSISLRLIFFIDSSDTTDRLITESRARLFPGSCPSFLFTSQLPKNRDAFTRVTLHTVLSIRVPPVPHGLWYLFDGQFEFRLPRTDFLRRFYGFFRNGSLGQSSPLRFRETCSVAKFSSFALLSEKSGRKSGREEFHSVEGTCVASCSLSSRTVPRFSMKLWKIHLAFPPSLLVYFSFELTRKPFELLGQKVEWSAFERF